jgi:phosphoribosylformylglycinamidine cyclo-ligase
LSKTYKDAGVDIDAAESSVRNIKSLIRSTFSSSVLADIGLFGGFFKPDFSHFNEPVLVSSVDGVGTKLNVAVRARKHDTIGSDLVNHCVNDIAVSGATPLFFMDYFATGRLDAVIFEDVIRGFVHACRENQCALIGGETAELPGMYKGEEYDLAGMIVGVVDKKNIIDGSRIQKGDVLVGLPSNGLHTNGYSLARAVLFDHFKLDQHIDELGCTLAEELLRIHRSYLHVIQRLIRDAAPRGFSHVTGGGIIGNTMRIVPENLSIRIHWDTWEVPPIFSMIQSAGNVDDAEMRRVFNMGIGLVVVVPEGNTEQIRAILRQGGEGAHIIGDVVLRN